MVLAEKPVLESGDAVPQYLVKLSPELELLVE